MRRIRWSQKASKMAEEVHDYDRLVAGRKTNWQSDFQCLVHFNKTATKRGFSLLGLFSTLLFEFIVAKLSNDCSSNIENGLVSFVRLTKPFAFRLKG